MTHKVLNTGKRSTKKREAKGRNLMRKQTSGVLATTKNSMRPKI